MKVLKKLKRLTLISRPLVWFPAIAVYLGGVLMGDSSWTWAAWLGLAFVTFPMGIIVYGVNDIADRESDAQNPLKGGAMGAVVEKSETRVLSAVVIIMALSFLLAFTLTMHYQAALCVLVIVAFAYLYSVKPVRLKSRPFLDSISNGLLWVIPIFACGYGVNAMDNNFVLPAWHVTLTLLLCSIAIHSITALRDYDVDRKVGDKTGCVILGKNKTLGLCAGLFIACLILVSSLPVMIYFGFCILATVVALLYPNLITPYRLTWLTVAPVPFLAAYIAIYGF